MATKRIEPSTFRLTRCDGHELYLEFDGLVGLQRGLEEFVWSWATSLVRPSGACFVLWVEGRDFTTLIYGGQNQPTVPVPLGAYLLLRVDAEHPYFGNTHPGWVLVRPNPDITRPAELIVSVQDWEAEFAQVRESLPERVSLVGP